MIVRNTVFAGILVSLAACGGPASETPASVASADEADGAPAAAPPESAGDWIPLLDGSGLERWQRVGDANWRLENGAVRADAGSGFLVSDAVYEDFDLELEFWVDVPANSGVFFRCTDGEEINDTRCYEANIFDTRPDQSYRSGAIVNVAEPRAQVNTGGRWNRYVISADGDRLRVELNGTVTVDTADERFEGGPIALQYGAGTVLFRDVRLRPR